MFITASGIGNPYDISDLEKEVDESIGRYHRMIGNIERFNNDPYMER